MNNFLVNKISQTTPLLAVFTLPCQGNEAIGECISQVYTVSLTLVGIVAFVQIVYGGFMLLTAAGNTSKTGQAMGKIKNAVLGMVLLFSSYLILKTINPDLVNFNFNFEKINKKEELGQRRDLPTEIENFNINPKFASWENDTNLYFTVKIFGRTSSINEVCGEEPVMKRDIFVKKPANTGTDSTAGINIGSMVFSGNEFGDGKAINKDFNRTIKESLTNNVVTFNRSNASSVEFYTTLSCGNRELNRSALVRVNLDW